MLNRLIYRYLKTNNQSINKNLILALLIIASSCSSVKQLAIERDTSEILKSSSVFSKHFTGFSLYDIEEEKLIASYNSDLLFTPASNTKLLTMYVTLRSFQDSIPGGLYKQDRGTIHVEPVGDPTFLHPGFTSQPLLNRLLDFDTLVIIDRKEEVDPYGPGWAWDDYSYSFQPQRSLWPIYGNVVAIKKSDTTLTVVPRFFDDFVEVSNGSDKSPARDLRFNRFTIANEQDSTYEWQKIPFETSNELLLELLKDTLRIEIGVDINNSEDLDTLFSQHVDTILSRMMKPSDNFLAEQLLMMSAWKNGYGSLEDFRSFVKNVWLTELDDMVWVDGSGLSRYNLISPISQTRLLKKSIDTFGWDRIAKILPSGGEGTLKELYLSEKPYLFAKTGTLSNNHNLTGLLITNSGKRLIFSLMNNHYARPTQEIKKAMEVFLNQVREAY